jgi:hypothetical protein
MPQLLQHIMRILDTGNVHSQKALFDEIERIAREDKFHKPFDDWKDALIFMHKYK